MASPSHLTGLKVEGAADLGMVTPGAGSATIKIRNDHSADAFNGTLVIGFLLLNLQ